MTKKENDRLIYKVGQDIGHDNRILWYLSDPRYSLYNPNKDYASMYERIRQEKDFLIYWRDLIDETDLVTPPIPRGYIMPRPLVDKEHPR